ncbi:MAG: hypothetical protein GY847_38305 [Proteobacteria bacterium]|nr:hypothetical protein [Pseudomonadota bacterium]
MRAEIQRSYRHGFLLKETDLRRMVDLVRGRLGRRDDKEDINATFTTRLRDGGIAETDSLDELMELDNEGPGKVVGLTLEISDSDANRVLLGFREPQERDGELEDAISLEVRGSTRDFAFIISSQLEERIQKIKRVQLSKLFRWEFLLAACLIVFIAGLLLFLFDDGAEDNEMIDYRHKRQSFLESLPEFKEPDTPPASALLESAYEESGSEDLVKFLILVLKQNEQQVAARDEAYEEYEAERTLAIEQWETDNPTPDLSDPSDPSEVDLDLWDPFRSALLLVVGFGFVCGIVRLAASYTYPIYVFCWADQEEEFKKRESIRSFLLRAVFIGIVVSFFGSILATLVRN